jgi:cytidine deaminase
LRHVNTCAERVAIGLAASNGERQFEAIAAVAMMSSTDQPTLVSPCGICREVIVFYGPDITVLFVEDGHIRKARARDLLPGGYVEPELGGSGSLRDVAGTDAVPPGGSE